MQNFDLEKSRHSMAHILAQALLRLYPNAKLGIGPVVENGFYYEIETEYDINDADFPKIEEEMHSIIQAAQPITQIFVSREEAYNLLLHQGQIYKTEILEEIDQEEVSIFKTGEEFLDLCSGPHVLSTSDVGFFKLIKIEEGHWRGLINRPKMKKIYGVGFLNKSDLIKYLEDQEKLKEIDHRKLGQQLGFYKITKQSGFGLPLWLPKGAKLRKTILTYLSDEKEKEGFKEVHTPQLIPSKSDILDITSEEILNQFFPELKDKKDRYVLRAENIPLHYQIFKAKTRSYRELPYKIYEHGEVYRNEGDHELHGLAKSRIFTSESNHIFCTEEQLFQEILGVYQLTSRILARLGFRDYKIQLSTNTQNHDKRFQWANQVMMQVIKTLKLVSRQVEDKSTQNGPKIEFFIKDLFGKEWQISSIQLDIFSTLKQGLTYINNNGENKEVLVIRSTIIGSIERIIGLLIEKNEGNLPLWISPEQIRVLPISKRYNIYADLVESKLKEYDLRVTTDKNDETLQYRIKLAQEDRVPYMVIVGSKEESSKSLSIRPREGQDLGLMKMEEFLEMISRDLH